MRLYLNRQRRERRTLDQQRVPDRRELSRRKINIQDHTMNC
jgi:hypothetical protein